MVGRRLTALTIALLGLLAPAAGRAVGGQGADDRFAACEASFAAAREDWKACGCFYRVGRENGLQGEAARRLAGHLAAEPGNACLLFNLGRLRAEEGDATAAGQLFQTAAAAFASREAHAGEVYARINLSRSLRVVGRAAEAWDQHEQAIAAAQRNGDEALLLTVELEKARLLLEEGSDLAAVDRLLRRLEPRLFPAADAPTQRTALLALCRVRHRLGRFDEAEAYARRLLALAESMDDRFGAAVARLNLVAIHLERTPYRGARAAGITLAQEALAAAEASGYFAGKVEGRIRLGRLLPAAEGRAALEEAVTLARQGGDPELLATACGNLAGELAADDPDAAARYLEEARLAVQVAAEPWAETLGWAPRMRVSWATHPAAEALATSRTVLDLIEGLRDLQRAEGGRAAFFAQWTEAYYWLAGHLLAAPEPATAEAFAIAERMRGRVLLEALAAVEDNAVQDSAVPAPADAALGTVLAAIVAVNRRLLDPQLTAEARRAALDELAALELEAAELRDRLGEGRLPIHQGFSTLDEVRGQLAADEALLAFQVGLWEDIYGDFSGGAWLTVLTREGVAFHRLPDRAALEPAVRMLNGLFPRRDGAERVPASGLYGQLLAPALEGLPAAITRLVIVPDGVLHLLPFAALRPAPDAPPLAARYALTVAPSATLWQRWRQQKARVAPAPVLALIDPTLPAGSAPAPASVRAWSLSEGMRLGALPHARREGRALARHLGRGSELLIGDGASEQALSTAALGRYGVLHFAAHAVLDDEHPERSAIVLTPGDPAQDGLLQPHEITGLDLEGTLVVLSACRSASGALLLGEGTLSLARAFFQAGARAVVGSLWQLRDDQAATFFDAFYRALATGARVSDAVATAQRAQLRAGAAAEAWAGIVVLGDGDLVPFPGGRRGSSPWWWAMAAGVAVVLAVGFFAARRAAQIS